MKDFPKPEGVQKREEEPKREKQNTNRLSLSPLW